MSSLSCRMNIARVNIRFFTGFKKIKQRRIFFVLGYLRMILWKISTAIYLYGFLDQSLGLILGTIFCIIKITACMPLTVFRKSYFLPWAVLHKRFYAVSLTSQHPLEKAHVVALSTSKQDRGAFKHTNYRIVPWNKKHSGKTTFRQPSIDFHFCNVSSSGDVVYMERWRHLHKLVTDFFFAILWAFYVFKYLNETCHQIGKYQ